jgi:hypothetical protein
MFIIIIAIFFTLLILFSLVRNITKPILIEGATGDRTGTYQDYSDDPLILAKKNAANISVLKDKIDEISGISQQVKTNTSTIDTNSKTIHSLMASMSPSSQKSSQKNQALIDKTPKTFNM